MAAMKKRIDTILVEKGLASYREKAKTYITEGWVKVNSIPVNKSSETFDSDDILIDLQDIATAGYVSRGGLKLEKALKNFAIDIKDQVCLDIGASTGGFTDCMLKHGAARVYAIDAGSGQLAPALKNDIRVINMEKTNFRYLTAADLPDTVGFVAADVSFISLKLILPVAYGMLSPGGKMVCLIKPQFEAGIDSLRKHGIVKDKKTHLRVINDIMNFATAMGFTVRNLDYAPVAMKKNIEYLLHLGNQPNSRPDAEINIEHVIKLAMNERP
jgi:23S rRNA (cytidine1920-2'-O)/16S rRNA (cytidine1409-2'-O)-methyltransferase